MLVFVVQFRAEKSKIKDDNEEDVKNDNYENIKMCRYNVAVAMAFSQMCFPFGCECYCDVIGRNK